MGRYISRHPGSVLLGSTVRHEKGTPFICSLSSRLDCPYFLLYPHIGHHHHHRYHIHHYPWFLPCCQPFYFHPVTICSLQLKLHPYIAFSLHVPSLYKMLDNQYWLTNNWQNSLISCPLDLDHFKLQGRQDITKRKRKQGKWGEVELEEKGWKEGCVLLSNIFQLKEEIFNGYI